MSDLYLNACTRMANGGLNWPNYGLYMSVLDKSYVPDFEKHHIYSDVPRTSVLVDAVQAANPSPTVVDGWCFYRMVYIPSFGPVPSTPHAVLVMQDVTGSGYPGLSLVAYIDQGYNFNEMLTRQQGLYLLWPGAGVFRP